MARADLTAVSAGGGLSLEIVRVQLGDGVGLHQFLVAGGLSMGVGGVGLGGGEVGLGLGELLVDFRGFDVGQQLAFADMGADIEIPLLQIAIGAGIDGRIGEGLKIAGQDDLLLRLAPNGRIDDHRRSGESVCVVCDRGPRVDAPDDSRCSENGPDGENDQQQQDGATDGEGLGPLRLGHRVFRFVRLMFAHRWFPPFGDREQPLSTGHFP